MRCLSFLASRRGSIPRMRTVPRSGVRSPARHSTVVVLPAPLEPTIPKISPRPTANETSSTATTLP
jgi:hypothetical protein